MSGYLYWPQFTKRKKHVVGITTRTPEGNFRWLQNFIMKEYPDQIDVVHLPITNDNSSGWMEDVNTCSAIILYHTKHQGRVNITNVEGALYEKELGYLNNVLGREKVMVLLDDMEDISEEQRQRILNTQTSLDHFSSHLILIPEIHKSEVAKRKLTEFCTALLAGVKTSQQKESLGFVSAIKKMYTSSGDTEHSDPMYYGKREGVMQSINTTIGNLFTSKPSQSPPPSPPPPYQIGIFSRSAESNYTWLISSLKADGHMRSLDIKSVYITNDYETFSSGLQTCRFAILYHTKKQGRLNITDVPDSLYDFELRDMSKFFGKNNVIVVADDLKSSTPEEKERILELQPSISNYAKDLFLFTEGDKRTRNLETIKEIIQSQAQHKGPNKIHRVAPPTERELFEKNYGSSFESHKDIIAPNQVPTRGSSPSCSGQAQHKGPNKEHRVAPPTERETFEKNYRSSLDSHKNIIAPNQVPTWGSSPSCSGARISRWEVSPGFISFSKGSSSSGDAEHNDTINNSKWERSRPPAAGSTSGKPSKPRQSPLPPYRIGIFSRCAESNYKWLSDSLKEDDHTRSLDIKPVYITNDYETFSSGLKTCRFAILYHTQKHGRLNITNVQNSLYDDELKEMSRALGKKNVIVVADDLKSREPEDKERILEHQPSIPTYAKDLFLFTEHEKYRKNLEKIREIIQSSQAQHKGPNKEHRAAPPTEWEPFEKNYGSSLDSHKNIIAPNQVPTWGSSPSCSGQAQHNNYGREHEAASHRDGESSVRNSGSSVDSAKNRMAPDQRFPWDSSPSCSPVGGQIAVIAGPQSKRSKTSSNNSMEGKCDLPEAPSPDSLSAPNKKLYDLQQENRELRKAKLSHEEKIKELNALVNSLTLEKNWVAEELKKIIQGGVDEHGEEIGERMKLLLQREPNEKEIDMDTWAHGHATLPQVQERFPENGHHLKEHHLQKTAGLSCLQNQTINELITRIQEIINEKDLMIQRQSDEIKTYKFLLENNLRK